jgi:hypothetical protein
MEQIVLKYLNDNYKFTLSTYVSYKLKEISTGNDVSLKDVLIQLETIFSLDEEQQRMIFDKWADIKSVELNNIIVEVQEKLYILTGKEISIDPSEMNGLIDTPDNLDNFIRNYIVL